MPGAPEASARVAAPLPARLVAFGGIFFSMGAFNPFLSGGKSAGFDNAQLMLFICYFAGLWYLLGALRGVRVASAPGALPLYLAYCLISVVWAGFAQIVFLKSAFYVLAALFAFFMASQLDRETVASLVFWAFFAGVAGSLLLAVGMPAEGVHQESYLLGLWKGIFVQKNHLGRACVILTNFALLGGVAATLRWRVLAVILAVVVCTLTGSLTSLLLLAYVVFIALLLRRFNARSTLAISAFLGLLALAMLQILPDLLALLGRDMSLTGRTYVWDACWHAFGESPLLGKGFNAFWSREFGYLSPLFYSESWMMADSHNGYLDLLLDLGLVGGLLFLACVVGTLRESIRSGDESLARLVVLLLLPLLARNLTESSLNKPTNVEWIFFCYLYFLSHGVRPGRTRVPSGAAQAPQEGESPVAPLRLVDLRGFRSGVKRP